MPFFRKMGFICSFQIKSNGTAIVSKLACKVAVMMMTTTVTQVTTTVSTVATRPALAQKTVIRSDSVSDR